MMLFADGKSTGNGRSGVARRAANLTERNDGIFSVRQTPSADGEGTVTLLQIPNLSAS